MEVKRSSWRYPWINWFFRHIVVDEYRNQCREHATFVDTTLALFKGELSIYDIYYVLPFRRLLELRTARVERLIEENKSEEEKMQEQRRNKLGIVFCKNNH